jgi:O-antigen/teichoic acid export membrane protein
LLLPLYSFYLEPEGYGVYILAYSFMTFLVTILSMQLHGSIGRFYFDFHGADKRTYLSSLMLLLLVVSLLGTLLVDYTLDGILQWVFPNIEEKYYNIFQMAVYIAFANILTQAQMALLRVREKARLFMFISVTVFLIGVSITIVELVVLKNGVYGLILSLVVQSILSCLLFSLANYDYFTIRIRFKVLEEPVRYSIPLVPHALAGFMFMYSDKIVLEKFISLEMLGIYALADKIASAFKVTVNQFNAAYSPVFNKTAKKSKELAVELSRSMASKLMLILTIGMIVLGLTSYEFVYYLFDEKYLDAWQFLPFLATAYHCIVSLPTAYFLISVPSTLPRLPL